MPRTTGRLLAASVWLAIVTMARLAPAQEGEEVEVEAPAPANGVLQVGAFDVEQWILGHPAAEARKKLESALGQDISRFDKRYGLSPTQKKKLELAGSRDMKRFFDRVEQVKSEFERSKGDWHAVGNRVFELQQINNSPHSELFGDESMLVKTLKKNLTPEQIARHEKTIYRARVEWMAGLLDKRLDLKAEQHQQLVTLVVDHTPPLKRYGSFDYDAIMFQISRLPRARLLATLDESQYRELSLRFDQARRMESILVSEGYLARTRPAAGPAAGDLKRPIEEARR